MTKLLLATFIVKKTGPMDGPTDQWTDIPSYRDAWKEEKEKKKKNTKAKMVKK